MLPKLNARRLHALRARHSILEAKIQKKQAQPNADYLRLSALKRMKLAIRDEIVTIERRLARHGELSGAHSGGRKAA